MTVTNKTSEPMAHHDNHIGPARSTHPPLKSRLVLFVGVVTMLVAVCSVQSVWLSYVVAGERQSQSDRTPAPGVSGPHDPQPLELDDEPDCPPWDGEKVYCDVIDSDVIINGTADSESIWIAWQSIEAESGHPTPVLTVLVMHSDASIEWFEFTLRDIMASGGYYDPLDLPSDWGPKLYIKSRCGHDVVVNTTGLRAYVKLGAGNDFYVGGDGVDIVDGQWGHDTIFGGRESDVVSGGTGQDLLFGGPPSAGLVSWPGVIDWSELPNPNSDTYDGERDDIDCGMDSDLDWIIVEIDVTDDGLTLAVDNVINLDFDSPPGTDHVFH